MKRIAPFKSRLLWLVIGISCAATYTGIYAQEIPRRKLIPDQQGEAVVASYTEALSNIHPDVIANWAQFHNGWGGRTDNCAHWRAEFLIWHHAYLVLTEELFTLAVSSKPFLMPYWSPAQSPRVPSVFRCSNGDPRCQLLKNTNRYPLPYPIFDIERASWQHVLDTGANSYFCSNPDGINALGGGITTDVSAGFLEQNVHERVHTKSTGVMENSWTAASDPLFQPFHAGIDAMLVRLLDSSPRLKCELCANHVTGSVPFIVESRIWSKLVLKDLPEPRCLSYDAPQKTFHVESERVVSIRDVVTNLDVAKKCSDLPKRGGFPTRSFNVGEVLRDTRFWQASYEGMGELTLEPPCTKQENQEQCAGVLINGDFSCPQAIRTRTIILSQNEAATEDDILFAETATGEVSYRLRLEGIQWGGQTRSPFRVSVAKGRRRVEMGTIQFSSWRASLVKHHIGNGDTVDFFADRSTAKQLSKLLGTTNSSKLKLNLSPIGKGGKVLPLIGSVRLEKYVLGKGPMLK